MKEQRSVARLPKQLMRSIESAAPKRGSFLVIRQRRRMLSLVPSSYRDRPPGLSGNKKGSYEHTQDLVQGVQSGGERR